VLRLPRRGSCEPEAESVRRAFQVCSAKIVEFEESGSVRRVFIQTPPGPESSFGIRAGSLLRRGE
jgi:hypothetical protein